jgi:hypothetical protein
MTEPPRPPAPVSLFGLTLAQYLRDEEGQDVLLFLANNFRFTQAGSEVSALLGRMPSAVGYQPTLATEMGELQERITTTKKRSITSVQATYVPADDLTDPAPAPTFAHLDATTVLSRQISELGIYPAVDPLDSTSRILDPRFVGDEHYRVARGVQQILQRYKDLQDIIAILGMDELSENPSPPVTPLKCPFFASPRHLPPRLPTPPPFFPSWPIRLRYSAFHSLHAPRFPPIPLVKQNLHPITPINLPCPFCQQFTCSNCANCAIGFHLIFPLCALCITQP